jgi:hypothetical protein
MEGYIMDMEFTNILNIKETMTDSLVVRTTAELPIHTIFVNNITCERVSIDSILIDNNILRNETESLKRTIEKLQDNIENIMVSVKTLQNWSQI